MVCGGGSPPHPAALTGLQDARLGLLFIEQVLADRYRLREEKNSLNEGPLITSRPFFYFVLRWNPPKGPVFSLFAAPFEPQQVLPFAHSELQ